jgi:phosphoribosylaminoimidazole (AIR) synthetase
VFTWLAAAGGLDQAEMAGTFNCGIGMVLIVQAGAADDLTRLLAQTGETVTPIGRIVPRTDAGERVRIGGTKEAWEC